MSSQLTWENIEPLVANAEQQHTSIQVTFRCPVTGTEVQSSAAAKQGAASRAKSQVKRSLWWSVRSALASAVRSAVGGGMAGSAASSMVYGGSMGSGSSTVSLSEGEKQQAIVEAFKRVARQFAWDPNSKRFLSASHFAELMSDFVQLTSSTPIQAGWDRGVLARMLAEIAAADGTIAEEERELFTAFVGEGQSIDDLTRKAPLSQAELAETSEAARPAMFAIAAAVAMADEEFDAAEQGKLQHFAAGMGFNSQQVSELLRVAREHIVDLMLESVYLDGDVDAAERSRVENLAARLGVDQNTVERLDIRVRKRKGLV